MKKSWDIKTYGTGPFKQKRDLVFAKPQKLNNLFQLD